MQPETAALFEKISALDPPSVDKPTLVYFDIIGIAWPIRCLLHLCDVDYALIQITLAQWFDPDETGDPVLKHAFRNGHIPLYVDREIALNQSQLILDHLMGKHGLDGQTVQEKYAVREVMWQAYDALFHFNGLFPVNIRIGLPDEIAGARLSAFMGEGDWPLSSKGFDNNLRAFERYLQANPADSGFFVGETLTTADLCAFNVLCNWYKAFAPDRFATGYPELDAFIMRIAAIPKVADFIKHKQEPTTWFPLPHVAMRLTSPEELSGLTGA